MTPKRMLLENAPLEFVKPELKKLIAEAQKTYEAAVLEAVRTFTAQEPALSKDTTPEDYEDALQMTAAVIGAIAMLENQSPAVLLRVIKILDQGLGILALRDLARRASPEGVEDLRKLKTKGVH